MFHRSYRALLLCLVLAAMSLAGCATMGRDFPSGMVSELQVGKTTQEQVRAMFGRPWRVGVENGQRTWTYATYRYSLVEMFARSFTEDLVLHFDNRGVVSSYAYNSTRHQQ